MRAQERLRPRTIFFPALPEPRPHGPLNPELLVIEESFEDLERLVPFSPEHEVVPRSDRESPSPQPLGVRPPQAVREPLPSRPPDRRGRAEALSWATKSRRTAVASKAIVARPERR